MRRSSGEKQPARDDPAGQRGPFFSVFFSHGCTPRHTERCECADDEYKSCKSQAYEVVAVEFITDAGYRAGRPAQRIRVRTRWRQRHPQDVLHSVEHVRETERWDPHSRRRRQAGRHRRRRRHAWQGRIDVHRSNDARANLSITATVNRRYMCASLHLCTRRVHRIVSQSPRIFLIKMVLLFYTRIQIPVRNITPQKSKIDRELPVPTQCGVHETPRSRVDTRGCSPETAAGVSRRSPGKSEAVAAEEGVVRGLHQVQENSRHGTV